MLLLSGMGIANAQNTPGPSNRDPAVTSSDLIEATREYRANTEELLQLQEEELKKATQKLEQLRLLAADGLIARNELEESEESVATLQATLAESRKKIGDSDLMIAEIQSELIRNTQTLAQTGMGNKPRSFVRSTVLRYNGAAHWSITQLAGIQSFFNLTFGRSLPTSTIGQSATHNRLGWDHRNSVDIPLHPDSEEGKTLISFLQNQGIPFLAFRGAIPGVSTGAHIHIGRPSQRLS